ncbi:hypothetical protein V1264_000477 [Littorina saxatilis]|uniref:Uncharacterized protein n=1 Tax=Littorina saxatilis TaxID=31220 RepID=A0AAN9C0C1_9CAEN
MPSPTSKTQTENKKTDNLVLFGLKVPFPLPGIPGFFVTEWLTTFNNVASRHYFKSRATKHRHKACSRDARGSACSSKLSNRLRIELNGAQNESWDCLGLPFGNNRFLHFGVHQIEFRVLEMLFRRKVRRTAYNARPCFTNFEHD